MVQMTGDGAWTRLRGGEAEKREESGYILELEMTSSAGKLRLGCKREE